MKALPVIEEYLGSRLSKEHRSLVAKETFPDYSCSAKQIEALSDFLSAQDRISAASPQGASDAEEAAGASVSRVYALAYSVVHTQLQSDDAVMDLVSLQPSPAVAVAALAMYLDRAREPLLSFKAYVYFNEFYAKVWDVGMRPEL
jgi:hypothetical protein